MRVAVTGSKGFIGSYLTRKLKEKEYDVIGLDIVENPKIDILDLEQTKQALKDVEAVYHLAGPVLMQARKKPYESNLLQVNGTANVLETCRTNDIPKVLFASTFYVYDGMGEKEIVNEETRLDILKAELFGSMKLMGESMVREYAKKYGFNYITFRFGSAYGAGNCTNVVRDFIDAAQEKRKFDIWGEGKRKNQYTYAGDIADGCVLALDERNEIFNLISPEQTSTRELAELINKKIGFDYFFDTTKQEGKSQPYMSSRKAVKELGWKPHNVDEGVDITIKDLKELTNK